MPVSSLRSLTPISALASSISSRTSSAACSEISVSAAAMFAGTSSCSVATATSARQAPQQEGGDQPAGEGRADEQLGTRPRQRRRRRRAAGIRTLPSRSWSPEPFVDAS